MEIHILRGGQQYGPYSLEQIKAWLLSGEVSPTVVSSHDGGVNWIPLFCLPPICTDESLSRVVRTATSGDPEIEAKVLQETVSEIERLLSNTDPVAVAQVQNRVHWKLRIYWKQIYAFKAQFPEEPASRAFEAVYFSLQARIKLSSVGFMRKQAATTDSVTWSIVSGMLANKQERNNALEALSLLDQAISIFDNADDRWAKAFIYHEFKQNENALRELNHIITNFPNDPLYFDARRLKDEIETL
jgi:hypothetical protein